MSEQKRSTPQRSEAPTQRRRSGSSPRRRPSRRGGMPQWLSGWLEHMALFFSTLGARIRRIGPRARTVMRESRARNFPESNRFLVQVFLVIGGMFPMWRSLLHERVMAHRRQRSHAAGEHEDRWRRHARRVNPFYFIGGAAVVAAIALFFSFYTLGTTVEYNGSVVDTVASAAQARKAASKLESITTETLGKSYEIAKDAIHYSTAFVRRSDVTDSTTFEQDLADELGQVTYGYSLYVDDELIGSTQYAGALDELLKQIKQVYASADTLSVDFVENVRIAEGYVPTDSVMNLGEIAEILNSTKSGEVTYTVVKGDTWGQIANNNGMTAAELEALNPGYDINRIHIGDALTLSNAVPYLTVKVTERQNYVEDVNYDVNYVSDSSMYQGDERVISKGSFGKADIVADVPTSTARSRSARSSRPSRSPTLWPRRAPAARRSARPGTLPAASAGRARAASPRALVTATPASAARRETTRASTSPARAARRSTLPTADASSSPVIRARWAMLSSSTTTTAM